MHGWARLKASNPISQAQPSDVAWIYNGYLHLFARDVSASDSLGAHGFTHIAAELVQLGFGNVGKHLRAMGISVKRDLWD